MSSGNRNENKVFEASKESKGKALQFRLFAGLGWLIAIGLQIYAILYLLTDPINMGLLIGVIVGILILALLGSFLWKKANRLDPASEKQKVKFFVQNQLGAIMAVLAFLPLVIFIFTNKDMDGKQKGIVGGIAIVALLIAGIAGVDFDPPSIEKYTEQINQQTDVVRKLNFDSDNVYWAQHGNRYHIFQDCQHIRDREGVANGTVEESWDAKGISELCRTCQSRAIREREISESELESLMEGTTDEMMEETAEEIME